MALADSSFLCIKVALLAEGVDRNVVFRFLPMRYTVALLAEGVDRNFSS